MKSIVLMLSLLIFSGVPTVQAAGSCSVQIPFSGTCTLWYGYGSGQKEVKVPATITLSGGVENPDQPTHFNCRLDRSATVPTTQGGWVLVKDGPSRAVPFIAGAVTMPSDQYGGLASDGAAITCPAMVPRGN